MTPFVTIVMPIRNEARFIRDTLLQVINQDYPLDCFEIIVADGMSDDGTRAIVMEMAQQYPQIRLLDNPARLSSAGRNAFLQPTSLKSFVEQATDFIEKGKFLLLGLTKLPTLLSMFASMGVYWALYGWRYAVGLVVSIYLHEMGHMWAFRRFGVPATAPMFIPMFGAFVRSEAPIASAHDDARIGLGGPWWGLGACLLFESGAQVMDLRWMSAVAHTGAVINLFNLVPVFGLDGSHAYKVLGRKQRGIILGTMLGMWYLSSETMFFLIAIGATYRMFTKDLPEREDNGVLYQFVGLLVAFGLLSMLTAHWDRSLLSGD